MNHSPAYIVREYLIDQGDVTDPENSGSWPAFVGNLPDGVNVDHDAIGCIDTTPVKDGRIMGGAPLFHYGFQLLLRASAYNTGYAKLDALADELATVDDDQVTIGSNVYKINSITQVTGVVSLGQEEGTKRRELFSVNFLATIQEVS